MKPRIGLMIIATGRYKQLVEPLLASAQEFFFPLNPVTRFLFSDEDCGHPDTVFLPIRHEEWPLVTLKRYHYFMQYAGRLRDMDYLYYIDVDMRFVKACADEMLPDSATGLVAVEHPGFYRPELTFAQRLAYWARELAWPQPPLKHHELPFERNPASRACVSDPRHCIYYYGGFNGGTANSFLEMSGTLSEAVGQDLHAGIVAEWHDESHMNRYFYEHVPKCLPPNYSYPEQPRCPHIGHLEPIILALHKDHAYFRQAQL